MSANRSSITIISSRRSSQSAPRSSVKCASSVTRLTSTPSWLAMRVRTSLEARISLVAVAFILHFKLAMVMIRPPESVKHRQKAPQRKRPCRSRATARRSLLPPSFWLRKTTYASAARFRASGCDRETVMISLSLSCSIFGGANARCSRSKGRRLERSHSVFRKRRTGSIPVRQESTAFTRRHEKPIGCRFSPSQLTCDCADGRRRGHGGGPTCGGRASTRRADCLTAWRTRVSFTTRRSSSWPSWY